MPSFKAKVRRKVTHGDGSLNLIVDVDTDTCDPTSLGASAATIEGTSEVTAPEGAYEAPRAVTSFPVGEVQKFKVNHIVRISWGSNDGPILNDLSIAFA
jgi:hypothetical protein